MQLNNARMGNMHGLPAPAAVMDAGTAAQLAMLESCSNDGLNHAFQQVCRPLLPPFLAYLSYVVHVVALVTLHAPADPQTLAMTSPMKPAPPVRDLPAHFACIFAHFNMTLFEWTAPRGERPFSL